MTSGEFRKGYTFCGGPAVSNQSVKCLYQRSTTTQNQGGSSSLLYRFTSSFQTRSIDHCSVPLSLTLVALGVFC